MEGMLISNTKTKRITFRVEDRLYKFLGDFSAEQGMDISALCRNVITWFFMSLFLGEVKTAGLQDRFMRKYGKLKNIKGSDKKS
jgi:ABC-type long-subunit fatty acid transport system fused permease/ATPase subunit